MHRLTLQLGDNGHNIIETRPPVVLEVDNSGAHADFTSLEYRSLPFGGWNTVDMHFCPTIHRAGQSIQLRIGIHAWANNLRSVETGFSGCGGGSPILVSGLEGAQSGVPMGTHTTSYWHKNANDNDLSSFVVWEVDEGTHPPGAYTFGLTSYSRAFNPDDGHLFDPTHADVDYNPTLSWYPTSLAVAIVE